MSDSGLMAKLTMFMVCLCMAGLIIGGCGSGGGGGSAAGGSQQGTVQGTRGIIEITAPFPGNAKAAPKYIPSNVALYTITVCELDTTTAVIDPLVINSPTDGSQEVTQVIQNVPIGWKTVRIAAYDSSKNLLAQGASDAEVVAGTTGTEVTVTLVPLSEPPSVSSTTPPSGATGVSINTQISAFFTTTMDPSSFTTDTFTLTGPSGIVPGTVSVTGSTAVFTPGAALSPLTSYTAKIFSSVKNSAGVAMGSDSAWSFTTGEKPDTTPPKVQTTSPQSGATGVALTEIISVVFTKDIDPATVNDTTFKVTAGGVPVSGTISTVGNSVTFIPTTQFTGLTSYTVTLSGQIKDLAGNAMGTDYTWSFTTASSGGGGGGGGGSSYSWYVENQQPTNNKLNGVWVDPTLKDTFAVGDGGTIIHFSMSSRTWTNSTSSSLTTANLNAIWGEHVAGKSYVWAVGDGGVILYYNGSSWTTQTNPTSTNLYGIFGINGSSITAVGADGTIVWFNGTIWADKTISPSISDDFKAVWGTSAPFYYAIGQNGIFYGGNPSVGSFSSLPSLPSAGQTGTCIYGYAGNDIYAGCTDGNEYHYNGGAWNTLTPINLGYAIRGLWLCSAPNRRFFAMDYNPSSPSNNIYYFNATPALKQMQTQSININFNAVCGSASDHVVAVGDGGQVRTYDGNTLAGPSGMEGMWNSNPPQWWDVWGTGASDIYICGDSGGIGHYNGSSWSNISVPTLDPYPSSYVFNTVWGSSATDVYFGGDYMYNSSLSTRILHFDGSSGWNNNSIGGGTSAAIYKMLGFNSSTIFATGGMGYGLTLNGVNTWIHNDIPTTASPNTNFDGYGAWGTSSTQGWVAGYDQSAGGSGLVYYNSGTGWSIVYSISGKKLNDIWGSSASDIFVVGQTGTIVHFCGSAWTPMTGIPTSEDLFGVWGSSGSDVFAVGNNGTVIHYNGSTWSTQSSGAAPHSLRAVWGTSSSNVYAVGSEGTVIHYK
ncbi:MAG: Ig-like domain-containing protein [Candidatus Eremiobacteraeota bacterium]|nr:Ig-like domain-containing protein [Candidatus Eremiobacteraeota bacterium]